MTNGGSWTPAPRGGLIPLHPLGFGTILGKSFAALRSNPKVLLGFAIGLQLAASVLLIAGAGTVAFLAFSRLDTVTPGTEDYAEIEAGAGLVTGAAYLVLSIVLMAVSIIVQAVVVGEVSYSALGEKATLGRVWGRVKGRIWPLVGLTVFFAVIVTVAVMVIALLVALVFLASETAGTVVSVVLLLLGIPGFLVLVFWLYTKLYVVTPAIVLERAGVFTAIRRSWTLTKGRFWPTFGVYILLSLILGTASSVIIYPLTFLGMLLGTVIAPTGGMEGTIVMSVASIGLMSIGAFLVQCVTAVVMSTSSVLVYLDLRMRREGIDLRMQRYVEARDSGGSAPGDPYAYDPNDVAPPRPPFGYGPAYGAPGHGHPAPGYPAPGYPAAYPAQPGPYPPQGQPGGGQAPGQPAPGAWPPMPPQQPGAYPPPGQQPGPYAAPGQQPGAYPPPGQPGAYPPPGQQGTYPPPGQKPGPSGSPQQPGAYRPPWEQPDDPAGGSGAR